MPNISITPCTLADITELMAVAVKSYNQHYTHLWFDNGADYVEKCFTRAPLEKELADDNAAFFLIYSEEELVGFLKLNIDEALKGYIEQECLELERIYLIKEASGRGIGQQVVKFTEEFARVRNKKIIWLKAMDTSDDAVRFYEKCGFRKYSTHLLDKPIMKPEYSGMFIMKMELGEQ